ncbi:hypothetical protein [Xanthomonas sp. WHRI 10208]|uniref:hypothetical protein n=1 Tax=Xanthomonas sp. WHRI 10208 TaxID=3161564 RepID=UPI0032E9110D
MTATSYALENWHIDLECDLRCDSAGMTWAFDRRALLLVLAGVAKASFKILVISIYACLTASFSAASSCSLCWRFTADMAMEIFFFLSFLSFRSSWACLHFWFWPCPHCTCFLG